MGVSWEEAGAYGPWAGGRVPAEAGWGEAAAGSDGRKYPWGNEAPDKTRAVFNLDFDTGQPASVGRLPKGASPFGALDMAGNVFEWCADWYEKDYYEKSPGADPRGPANGTSRVLRGGSWFYPPIFLRVAGRGGSTPDVRYIVVGFRAARTFE